MTTWSLWACGNGRHWSSTTNYDESRPGHICNFSGCGCGTPVRKVGETRERDVALAHWESGTQCGTTHEVQS